ncbi:toprim domain-containing protein [Pseudomonas aeruginosa]|uniref:toprim domain-containing protein n=1 Tax=Pseudomonas aeruginosa TaxID=287 RepID=UPI001E07B262|nr:toprim domain-containing protein [Pseudomonas aeruginosa]MBX6698669.1 toprim domain-containing protein [Pseudomonas aeruginosa]MDI3821040.1 toprim domain-containing protein [Pseudomonas aeruginosa]
MNARVSQDQFDEIYRQDVLPALESDTELDFKPHEASEKYLNNGVCPGCGKRSLYISRQKPFQLKCNRLNKCQYEEKTRDRYSYLFENLSDRFPRSEADPHATARAYLQRARGFNTDRLAGCYEQARYKTKSGEWVETVRFPLCDGYWERLIDQRGIQANEGKKAHIKYGTNYQNKGWTPPGQVIEKNDKVFIVEGIFHAIALWLAGYKVIASISANNFPWAYVDEHQSKLVTWTLALDNDKAGRTFTVKYRKQLAERNELVAVALLPLQGNGEPQDWDDVYRIGRLDETLVNDALYEGRLFTAPTPLNKAYVMFQRLNRSFFLLEFGNRLYSARVNKNELQTDGEAPGGGFLEEFKKHTTVEQVANCVPHFEYIQSDVITNEQQYFFRVAFPNGRNSVTVALTAGSIAEPRAFAKTLLERTPGGVFNGGEKVLSILREQWTENPDVVRTLPFVGYDEETGTYCFQDFGFIKGRELLANEHRYLDTGKGALKTALQSLHITYGEQVNLDWFDDLVAVHQMNGLAALSWWTGSLFTQQIKKMVGNYPYLEFTGQGGAGKSSLLRFLWRLFGRTNHEGIKPNGGGTSNVGLARVLAQVSNLPVVFIESDSESTDSQGRIIINQFNWDDHKDLFDYNGTLRTTGTKTTGPETASLLFRAALCIAQNNQVVASEPTLTRIVHLHATRDHHTIALKAVADRLHRLEVGHLAGYLRHCLANETLWLERFWKARDTYHKFLLGVSALKHFRIVDCHATVMAAAYATQGLLPGWTDELQLQVVQHLKNRAQHRQQVISSEPELLTKFWNIYHFLNERVVTITDQDGTREEIHETLNHSTDPALIAINLEHFTQASKNAGQELLPSTLLRRDLPKSQTYAFIENKKVRSALEKRPLQCWIFQKRCV